MHRKEARKSFIMAISIIAIFSAMLYFVGPSRELPCPEEQSIRVYNGNGAFVCVADVQRALSNMMAVSCSETV